MLHNEAGSDLEWHEQMRNAGMIAEAYGIVGAAGIQAGKANGEHGTADLPAEQEIETE